MEVYLQYLTMKVSFTRLYFSDECVGYTITELQHHDLEELSQKRMRGEIQYMVRIKEWTTFIPN